MIEIIFVNGDVRKFEKYKRYRYDGKFFIVFETNKSINFYNMDHILSITVKED